MHNGVLGVNICHWQLHNGKQFRCCRVFLGPGFVGNDMHGADREAIIRTIRQFGIGIFIARQCGELRPATRPHLSPASAHYSPSTASGIIKHRFALFVATDGVGHHRCVVPLIMRHGVGQFIRGKLVVDRPSQPQPGLHPVKSALPSPLVSNSLAIFGSFSCAMLVILYWSAVFLSIR